MIMWCYLGFSFLLCAFSFQSSSILIIHSIHSDYWPSDEPTILGRIHILQCLWWIQHICDSLEHLNSHAKQHCHLGINCSWCLVFIADYFSLHAQHEDWSSGWQNKINKQIFGLFYCLFIYLFPSFPFFPSFSVNIVWLADSNSLLSNVVHACFICRMQRLWFIFITSSFHSIPFSLWFIFFLPSFHSSLFLWFIWFSKHQTKPWCCVFNMKCCQHPRILFLDSLLLLIGDMESWFVSFILFIIHFVFPLSLFFYFSGCFDFIEQSHCSKHWWNSWFCSTFGDFNHWNVGFSWNCCIYNLLQSMLQDMGQCLSCLSFSFLFHSPQLIQFNIQFNSDWSLFRNFCCWIDWNHQSCFRTRRNNIHSSVCCILWRCCCWMPCVFLCESI